MKNTFAVVLAAASLTVGVGVGYASKVKGPGMTIIIGKEAKEAGLAALAEAERRSADEGSWEHIAIGRIYYLSGDKAKGQAIFDKYVSGGEASDWHRIGGVYAEAGENDKAEAMFQKALQPKDDTGHAEVGAWYIRTGQREKGEAMLAKAFARNPDEFWHYVRTAEAFLGVAPN